MKRLAVIPAYAWTFLALVAGIVLGGSLPGLLEPVARGTASLIRLIVTLVPLLIVAALSPAIATLLRRGLAGRFAGSVILWYVGSSALAGLIGLIVASLVFGLPVSTGSAGAWAEAAHMFRALAEQRNASLPLLAIVISVLLGAVALRFEPLFGVLARVEQGIANIGNRVGFAMIPLIFLFGISIGVRFGARLGMGHYLTMTGYTAALCLVWSSFYVFIVIRYLARRDVGKVITEYYVPTAIFAAGTCSSLATLPVNLANSKRYGVRDEVADFVLPFGAVVNLDASTLMYMAYAPFVLTYIFGIEIGWTILLVAWPALVLFTIAAPGLPAGIGTALWSSTLFASMVGLKGQESADFIATWIALSGGLPDMFRTATNCSGDGFTAIVFDSLFERFFAKS
jgi:Na+/H+-dicarboxylate symporter